MAASPWLVQMCMDAPSIGHFFQRHRPCSLSCLFLFACLAFSRSWYFIWLTGYDVSSEIPNLSVEKPSQFSWGYHNRNVRKGKKKILSKISSFLYYFSFHTFFFMLYVRMFLFINHSPFFARYATSPPTEYLKVFFGFSLSHAIIPSSPTNFASSTVSDDNVRAADRLYPEREKRPRFNDFPAKVFVQLVDEKTRNKNCKVSNSVYPPAILRN